MDTNDTDMKSMFSNLMKNAQKFQENLAGAYQNLAEKNKDKLIEGKAGGGLAKVYVNVKLQVVKIDPSPELFKESPEVVCELIAAATNSALQEAQKAIKEEMLSVTKQMGLPADLMPGAK